MKFSTPLLKGTLLSRYKRFFADVRLDDGQVVTCHCPNTGSMKTCAEPGMTVYVAYQPSPKRKLAYTWELAAVENGFIGINTARPNLIVEEALRAGRVTELGMYDVVRREVKQGESRFDFLLSGSGPDCYVEVKSVTLKGEGCVTFPDAVTSRGLKHLDELARLADSGKRAVQFFFVNRPEGEFFTVAESIDPAYASGLRRARDAGVELLAYRAKTTLEGMELGDRVAIRL